MNDFGKLSTYQCYFFDFDGVIVNSNNIKHKAFLEVCEFYAPACAEVYDKYLINNCGVNRSLKFDFLLVLMNQKPNLDLKNEMLKLFAVKMKNELVNSELVSGIKEFLSFLNDSGRPIYIVSAANAVEIREILMSKNILIHNDNIFGDLQDKSIVINNISKQLNFPNAIMFGDSYSDLMSAQKSSTDFCWVYEFAMTDLFEQYSDSIMFKIKNFNELTLDT